MKMRIYVINPNDTDEYISFLVEFCSTPEVQLSDNRKIAALRDGSEKMLSQSAEDRKTRLTFAFMHEEADNGDEQSNGYKLCHQLYKARIKNELITLFFRPDETDAIDDPGVCYEGALLNFDPALAALCLSGFNTGTHAPNLGDNPGAVYQFELWIKQSGYYDFFGAVPGEEGYPDDVLDVLDSITWGTDYEELIS